MNQLIKQIAFGALVSSLAQLTVAGKDHDQLTKAETSIEDGTNFSAKQLSLANIHVAALAPRIVSFKVYAPGEIKANAYTSYLVSPRVASVVLRRHAALGDHVATGQALVTLFSEDVADAQAAMRVADSEWQRVKQLGQKAVGESRFVLAQSDYQAAVGRLLAYGLSAATIQSLTEQDHPLGEYTLTAASQGTVFSDDFKQGQRVDSGAALMELADETTLWVEAYLAPTAQLNLPIGTEAQVTIGSDAYAASVIQEAPTIDAQTRTRIVRLLLTNHDTQQLQPGLFANVYFLSKTDSPVLAVPESALIRSADGDWQVFVEQQPGQFRAREVALGRSLGQLQEIRGIDSGTRIVMEGAFFIASEIGKSGFEDDDD